jgi:hypothetical protein
MDLKKEVIKAIREEVFMRWWDFAYDLEHPRPKRQSLWDLSAEYASCIEHFAGELADLLTQAHIARRKPITAQRRRRILHEVLRVSRPLMNSVFVEPWLAKAMGKTVRNWNKIPSDIRTEFIVLVENFLPTWLYEASRKITLRCFLSPVPSRPAPLPDLLKVNIAEIKMDHPNFSQRQICAKLDASNDRKRDCVPLPRSWRRFGERSWISAYDNTNLKPRVKKYLSTIKPAAPHKPLPPPKTLPELHR